MSAPACPICGADSAPSFRYDRAPEGEVHYPVFPEGRYFRQYFVCGGCGHYHSSFRWPEKAVYEGGYVQATYQSLDGVRKTFAKIRALPPERSDNAGRVRYIRAFLEGKAAAAGLRVLDVGSGLGVFPHAMREAGFEPTALDPDPTASAHMSGDLGLPVITDDFFRVAAERKFGLVTFNKVLEHVNDPAGMLARAKDFLSGPNGLVYVELPDGEAAGGDSQGREEFFIEHLHVFSFASMALLASRAGFRVLAMERLREPSTKYTLRGFFSPAGGRS